MMPNDETDESNAGGKEAPVVVTEPEKSQADMVRDEREKLKGENDAYEKEKLRAEQLRAEKQRGGRSTAGRETEEKTQ